MPVFLLCCYSQFATTFTLAWDNSVEQIQLKKLSLNRIEKSNFENCRSQKSKLNIARQKNSCSTGTFYCTQCAIIFTKPQNDLSLDTAKMCFLSWFPILNTSLTRKKCFNSFVQSTIKARRQTNENPTSSMVAETMNFFAENFLGYHNMDQSRHTVNKSTHAAVNTKLFRKFHQLNNSIYELDIAKAQIGHKKPITVGFFLF